MNLGSSNATQKAWLGVEEPWVHLSLQECLRQSPLRGGSFPRGKPTAGTSPLLVGLQLGTLCSVFLIPGLPPSHSDQSLPCYNPDHFSLSLPVNRSVFSVAQ